MTVAWGDTDIDYNLSGDTASRPAANTVEAGSTYANTETGVLYEQILGSWIAIADLSGVVGSPTYNGLDDVDMTGLVGGNFARWDAGLSMWKPVTIAASDLGSGASSAKFFRGDMAWSNDLVGPLVLSGATGNITSAGTGTNSFAGPLTNSVNGALSAPGLNLTGTWITGGSATTTKPYVLIEPTGTPSTGWSTSGTGLGINAPSGFAGKLASLQLAGVEQLSIGPTGIITIVGSVVGSSAQGINLPVGSAGNVSLALGPTGNNGFYLYSGNKVGLAINGGPEYRFGDDGIQLLNTTRWIGWGATAGTPDLTLYRDAAATLALRNGTAAQELRVYGTYANGGVDYERFVIRTAAGAYTIGQEMGGTGAARSLVMQTGGVTALTINTTQNVVFANQIYLPSPGSTGAPSLSFFGATTTGIYNRASSTIMSHVIGGVDTLEIGPSRVTLDDAVYFGWGATTSAAVPDAGFTRAGVNSLRLGAAPSAMPIVGVFTIGEDARVGVDSNLAGSVAYIRSGAGTGLGAVSSVIIQTPTIAASGTDAQTYATRLTIDSAAATFVPKVITALSATGGAGFNLPHGAAPTSPVDGDVWTTTAGLFVRINGVSKTVTLL